MELHASLHDYMLSMTWVCTGLVYDVTTAVRSYVQPLCCVQKTVFPCSCLPPQDLTLFPPSLPQWLVSLGKRGCSNCVLHRDEHSEVCNSVFSSQLKFSKLTIVYCKWKHIVWGMRYSALYIFLLHNNNKPLEVGLTLWQFGRITVVSSPLGPLTPVPTDSWPK